MHAEVRQFIINHGFRRVRFHDVWLFRTGAKLLDNGGMILPPDNPVQRQRLQLRFAELSLEAAQRAMVELLRGRPHNAILTAPGFLWPVAELGPAPAPDPGAMIDRLRFLIEARKTALEQAQNERPENQTRLAEALALAK